MGKKHNSDDSTGRRGRGDNRAASGSDNFRKFSSRPGADQPGNSRSGDAGRAGGSPSRPAFGRPTGKPGAGSGAGKRFGGAEGGPRTFGGGNGFNRDADRGNRGGFGNAGSGPRRQGDDRRPFNRDQNDDRRPANRDRGGNDDRRSFNQNGAGPNRPPRSFDRDASRGFDDRRGNRGGEERREERPARPYEPKANWPGQPYRQEGKPAVPRGGAGERNRKFNKVNPFEDKQATPPATPKREETFRPERGEGDTGPNREIRPARPFDYKKAPEGFGGERDQKSGGYERRERGEGSFGQRSAGERSYGSRSYGDRDERKGSDYGNRNTSSGAGERRFGDQREERPSPNKRFGRPADSNQAGKPKYGEVAGQAPDYKNLKHYEDDKQRGNKRRRNEEDFGNETLRLNRYIANAGICSRREADALIAAGEIRVNGEVVTEMGYQVQPSDTVQYGKTNLKREKLVYVLLNKPKDFITTTDDPEGRKTVMELIAGASSERLFPVGRLDRNTTGLLLFTNDGEVAQKLTHPSHKNKKIYQVELNKPLTEEHLRQIAEGIELEDGKAEVDDVAVVAGNPHFVGVELHVGRNRIVRRIFEHLGYEVVTLDRVQYAGLTKKDLPRGKWRFLNEKEVIRLKYFM